MDKILNKLTLHSEGSIVASRIAGWILIGGSLVALFILVLLPNTAGVENFQALGFTPSYLVLLLTWGIYFLAVMSRSDLGGLITSAALLCAIEIPLALLVETYDHLTSPLGGSGSDSMPSFLLNSSEYFLALLLSVGPFLLLLGHLRVAQFDRSTQVLLGFLAGLLPLVLVFVLSSTLLVPGLEFLYVRTAVIVLILILLWAIANEVSSVPRVVSSGTLVWVSCIAVIASAAIFGVTAYNDSELRSYSTVSSWSIALVDNTKNMLVRGVLKNIKSARPRELAYPDVSSQLQSLLGNLEDPEKSPSVAIMNMGDVLAVFDRYPDLRIFAILSTSDIARDDTEFGDILVAVARLGTLDAKSAQITSFVRAVDRYARGSHRSRICNDSSIISTSSLNATSSATQSSSHQKGDEYSGPLVKILQPATCRTQLAPTLAEEERLLSLVAPLEGGRSIPLRARLFLLKEKDPRVLSARGMYQLSELFTSKAVKNVSTHDHAPLE